MTACAPHKRRIHRYHRPHGELSLFSATTVFGTHLDVTVAELAIESFYPADDITAAALQRYI
ncbi:MAG TPA: hypothetical protein VE645_19895 [Pseudonocardiaceae bacterium]|nr:hypothetical protein [Pseudonocardiaceae bacterium]